MVAKVVCCAQPGLAAKTAGLLALRRALAHGAEKARRVNVHLAPKRAKATLMVLSSHAGHRVGSTSQSFLHFFFGFLHPPSPTVTCTRQSRYRNRPCRQPKGIARRVWDLTLEQKRCTKYREVLEQPEEVLEH